MKRHLLKIIVIFFLVLNSGRIVVLHAESAIFFDEYYHLLESITDKSAGERLDTLLQYLERHPEFDRVYLKILENYQTADDLAGAEDYFQTIKSTPASYRNSMWALARLYAKQKLFKPALEAYHSALGAGTPPPELLKDYADFWVDSPVKPAIQDTLFVSESDKNTKKLFYVYRDYKKQNYSAAIKKLSSFTYSNRDRLPLLYTNGFCLLKLNQFSRADSFFQAGLELSRQKTDRNYEILFICALGTLNLNKATYNRAIQFFETALPLAQAIDDIHYLLIIYENLGSLSEILGKYETAINYFNRAIITAQQNKQTDRLGFFFLNIGLSEHTRKHFSQALIYYDKCKKIAQITGNMELLIKTIVYRGILYDTLFQLKMAEREYNKASALAEKENIPNISRQLQIKQADISIKSKEYEKARNILNHTITQFTDKWDYISKADCQSRIGWTWWLENNYRKAYDYYHQAYLTMQEVDNSFYAAWYLLREAMIDVKCGRFNTAFVKLDTVISRGQRQNSVFLLRNAYSKKGWAYEEKGDINKAITFYKKAIPYTEIPRAEITAEALRIGYFSDNYQIYRGLTRCYRNRYLHEANPAYLDSMFYYEEKHRGRALKDNMNATQTYRNLNSKNENYSRACQNLQKTQYQLRLQAGTPHTPDQWDELIGGLEAAKYELVSQKLHIPDSLLQDNNKPSAQSATSFTVTRNNLKEHNCGMLMYQIDEKGSFVLVAAGDTTGLVSLDVKPDSLHVMIDSLMLPLRNINEESAGNVPFNAVLAYRLYKILFKPVAEQFPLPERLLIIPEGVLLNLPFEVLLQRIPEKAVYTPADDPVYADDFLLHKHSLFYSSTSAIFRDKKFSLLPKKNMLVFTNPYTRIEESTDKMLQFRFRTGWRFDPLPFADSEGQNIKKIIPTARVYNREKAVEQAFMLFAPRFNILHIATHAFVDTSFDDFSGLILAAGEDSIEDGILMGYEINELDLDNDLVTLSACETGRGKHVKAEGILGLPRLFLGAGARSVLMSMWKVDDRFTSLLMPEFYRYYFKEKLSKADALARAKRSLMYSDNTYPNYYYQHPFFWASFTLYGDPGPASHSTPIFLYLFGVFGLLFIFSGGYWIKKRKKLKNRPD